LPLSVPNVTDKRSGPWPEKNRPGVSNCTDDAGSAHPLTPIPLVITRLFVVEGTSRTIGGMNKTAPMRINTAIDEPHSNAGVAGKDSRPKTTN
jgi:hypothetical protein